MDKDAQLDVLGDARVRATLARLHALADRDATPYLRLALQLPRLLLKRALPWKRIEPHFDEAFLSINRSQGVYCYLLARALRARYVVEFGTSFGVSTIYLACAVRDNGGGRVIGTERVEAKAARAHAHLEEAGLGSYVEIRGGDAPGSLADLDNDVDFLLNDGFPRFALPVLQTVAPRMRSGAVVITDNVGFFPADHADYVKWVRNRDNGFLSSRIDLGAGMELSVRI